MDRGKLIVLVVVLMLSIGAYVTEATAGVSPLSACGSVGTGSYELTQNISTTGTCFTFTGDDITIDLNGFTIDGDDNNAVYGITEGVASRQNIVIRNGTIRDFNTAGINLPTSDGCMVEWILAFSNNNDGIDVGNHCNVSHNIAINNSVGIRTGSDSNISYNIANNNGSAGIGLIPGGNNVGSNISYNTANGNVNVGLDVACPSNLVGNIAQNNGTNLNQIGAGCKRYNNLF